MAAFANTHMPMGLTSPSTENPRRSAVSGQLLITVSAQPDSTPRTREEIDVARHLEITSKAISAILILMLKWFKASRKSSLEGDRRSSTDVLKFHNFAQLLLDSNCILLVLKTFGLQDVSTIVDVKNEWEDWK